MNLREYITFPLLETALISLSPVRGYDLLASHAGVIRGVVFLPFPSSSPVSLLAWNQASLWGVKEKVISVGEKKTAGFASLAGIFPIWPRFSVFAFYELPLCEAWSQATLPLVLFFFFFFFRFQDDRRDHIQWNPAITKCQGTEKIVRYSGIAKTPL